MGDYLRVVVNFLNWATIPNLYDISIRTYNIDDDAVSDLNEQLVASSAGFQEFLRGTNSQTTAENYAAAFNRDWGDTGTFPKGINATAFDTGNGYWGVELLANITDIKDVTTPDDEEYISYEVDIITTPTIIVPEIPDQVWSSVRTYKYLFEPLMATISESGAQIVYIDIVKRSLTTNAESAVYEEYVKATLNSDGEISLDFMEIAREFLSTHSFRIGDTDDIDTSSILMGSVLMFKVYTDLTPDPEVVTFIPILGSRSFEQFTGEVTSDSPLTEFEYDGIDQPEYKGYPKVTVSLKPSFNLDLNPDIDITTPVSGEVACGGYLLWKSRFGGWMTFGFDIETTTESIRSGGDLGKDTYRGNSHAGGNLYVPIDYTKVETDYKVNIRALGVDRNIAIPLKGLNYSPAAYYMSSTTSRLELMRLTSAAIPISNLMNGVDVSVALDSISKPYFNIR